MVAITITTAFIPRVAEKERFSLAEVAPNFWRTVAHYGFMERPDIPPLLQGLKAQGCTIDLSDVTYYVGLEAIVAREDGAGLPRWLVALFALIQRNATHVTDLFNFPRDRVMELGRQVAI